MLQLCKSGIVLLTYTLCIEMHIMEEEIYNKQITELLRKKKMLIDKLNELLHVVNSRRQENAGEAGHKGRLHPDEGARAPSE
ncbi:hypothetical protein [Taibaiella koreensis]|uniref:hypothetical protein n=1 Tax=Taibaiella koreensis TaxID=1268548 RepID=UPI0013C32878|nr:hypothetical protein [Taibaiella koreensis]